MCRVTRDSFHARLDHNDGDDDDDDDVGNDVMMMMMEKNTRGSCQVKRGTIPGSCCNPQK